METRPDTEAPTATNKAVFRAWFDETWNQGDPRAIDELTAADFVLHAAGPGRIAGVAALKETVRSWRAAFGGARMDIDFLFSEGDKVVARWTARGKHQDAFFGMPATGRDVAWTGITVYRLANGKVAEAWGEVDALGLMRQLGAGA